MTRAGRRMDESRFVELNSAIGPDLLRYFQRRVESEAADLLAETMLIAWRRRADLPDADEEARMWLFGVARNVLSNAVRGSRRRHALADALRGRLSSSAASDESALVDLRQVVDALPAELREVVLLAHWEGFSFAEIAVLQGVASATVRGRYRRARQLLRGALEHVD